MNWNFENIRVSLNYSILNFSVTRIDPTHGNILDPARNKPVFCPAIQLQASFTPGKEMIWFEYFSILEGKERRKKSDATEYIEVSVVLEEAILSFSLTHHSPPLRPPQQPPWPISFSSQQVNLAHASTNWQLFSTPLFYTIHSLSLLICVCVCVCTAISVCSTQLQLI